MLHLARPDDADVLAEIARAETRGFNYSEVGRTRDGETPPAGYVVDRYGCDLGSGERTFERAVAAIRNFAMYPASWMHVVAPRGVAEGSVFATLVHHLGFWSLNPCRIIDVVEDDESAEHDRFGFAFGTVEGHAERGEERFEVVWRRDSGVVRYQVLAFSRPDRLFARIGAPIARHYQRRFHRDTRAAMCAAVGRLDPGPAP